ncbi:MULTISPECIES: Cof-type HAD-IIB family hydrolase [Cytobacillus]|uniref:Haloacid dehalogenase n=2 Tax=Cytobacillus TaxID=2675230 RepID=A0ABX3CRK2_9BACI|nr:Cof-type HAD-IIB family hydrolase [Cytobacillus oceanisediminis]MCS0824992.1 Cof-type HAD-IIB family hydrolase [Cytobacillus firmus]MBU8732075.1 Cof-type HAD-IIB family hydrolase [Cytobacillus oceanisediminis]MCM3241238.1 Cof-type HAD-IIB family hydrolase [Cytobacillus oceanisediminis]MCM3404140.1 Cof-type HAD-IIB family hydrolase [Cytobacillus oceanisediminis]MDK7667914.1 Cof-type HAD-IIB family hydrolase [Cytobacillus oceanisediminis]
MIYRMLALNIDGTLLQSNGRLHKSTKEAIEYVQQKGIYVTLVTSRSFPSAKKAAKALKINSLLVTHRGAYIAASQEKPIFVKRIQEDETFEIVRLLEGFTCQIRLVHEKYSLANKTKLNTNMLAKTVFTTGDPIFYSQQFVDSLSDTILDEPVTPPKIEVYFEDKDDLEDVQAAIRGMFENVEVIKLSDLRMDIVPAGVSKLNGLLYLCEHLGISRNQMVVIGDSEDDLEMIEAAGLGVAMGNAPAEVKKAADWLTRSNDQNGVSYMVKEHFRKQHPIDFLKKMNLLK